MKSKFLIIVVTLCLLSGCDWFPKQEPILGTWDLFSQTRTDTNTTLYASDYPTEKMYLVIDESTWKWIVNSTIEQSGTWNLTSSDNYLFEETGDTQVIPARIADKDTLYWGEDSIDPYSVFHRRK